MDRERVGEIAKAIRAFLKNKGIKVDKIILFGSYAKGNNSKGSDLDIAIVSSDFNGKDIFQKADMLKGLHWYLVERFMFPFDIVSLSREEWQGSSSLIVDFVKEGKVLV